MKLTFALLLFILSGCAVKPTASLELNYSFPFSTDYWVHSDRSWQCEAPQIRGELGFETKNKLSFGLYHESFILCGSYNKKPEIFENGLYLKKQWGGW